jgi:hypothetical protein
MQAVPFLTATSSALLHFLSNFSSHFAKSGAVPFLMAFISAFCRQKAYLPASLFLVASHLSSAEIARARPPEAIDTPTVIAATRKAVVMCSLLPVV